MFRKLSAGALTSALLLVGAVACSDDETGPDLETNFTATLTGAAERPPVTTTATGTSTVTINDANSTITFLINTKRQYFHYLFGLCFVIGFTGVEADGAIMFDAILRCTETFPSY